MLLLSRIRLLINKLNVKFMQKMFMMPMESTKHINLGQQTLLPMVTYGQERNILRKVKVSFNKWQMSYFNH